MKPIRTLTLAAVAVLATHAMAQQPFTTDEARAVAASARAESAVEREFAPPVFEPVYPGDYQAAARNEGRIARFVEFHRSLQDDMDGVRSAPVSVDSEGSARQQASRRHSMRAMALRVAYLQSSPTAWLIHQEVAGEQGPLALR